MRIIIVGAGGHGQVVAEILWQMQGQEVMPIGYLDDNSRLVGRKLLDLPVLGPISNLGDYQHDAVIVAIGENVVRRRIFESLQQGGERFFTARHPAAIVSPSAQIGLGCMICAGVVIGVASSIESNTILNTACTVDHHNQIGSHCHIAPGAHLGGDVIVGDGALVGIGAAVLPRKAIGAASVVGAGACVVADVPPGVSVVGIPARQITGLHP